MRYRRLKCKAAAFVLLYLIIFMTGCALLPIMLNRAVMYSQLSNSLSIYASADYSRTAELQLRNDIIWNSSVRQAIKDKLSAFSSFRSLYSGFDNCLTGDFYHSQTGKTEDVNFEKIVVATLDGADIYSYKAKYDQNKLNEIPTAIFYTNDAYNDLNNFAFKEGAMFSGMPIEDDYTPIVVGGAALKRSVGLGDIAVIALRFRVNQQEIEPKILQCKVVGILNNYPMIYNDRTSALLPQTFLRQMDSVVLIPDMSNRIPQEADLLNNRYVQRRCLLIFESGTKVDREMLDLLNQALADFGNVTVSESVTQASAGSVWLDDMKQSGMPFLILFILIYITAIAITTIKAANTIAGITPRCWFIFVAGVILSVLAAFVTYWLVPYSPLNSFDLLNYDGLNASLFDFKIVTSVLVTISIVVMTINYFCISGKNEER